VAHLHDAFSPTLKKLTKQPTAPARQSAALIALRSKAEDILSALDRGWSANAIAEMLVAEAGDGMTFSTETIRTAIKRLQNESGASRRTSAPPRATYAAANADVSPIRSISSGTGDTSTHAGFAEDPT
jgi:DNA-binding NarL/FixJ family response regulator